MQRTQQRYFLWAKTPEGVIKSISTSTEAEAREEISKRNWNFLIGQYGAWPTKPSPPPVASPTPTPRPAPAPTPTPTPTVPSRPYGGRFEHLTGEKKAEAIRQYEAAGKPAGPFRIQPIGPFKGTPTPITDKATDLKDLDLEFPEGEAKDAFTTLSKLEDFMPSFVAKYITKLEEWRKELAPEITEARGAVEKAREWLGKKIEEPIDTAALWEAKLKEYGVTSDVLQQQADLRKEVASLASQINKEKVQLMVDIDKNRERRVAMPLIEAIEARMERDSLRKRALMGAELSGKAAALEAISGNITQARQLARDAVDLAIVDEEREFSRWTSWMNVNTNYLATLKAEDRRLFDDAYNAVVDAYNIAREEKQRVMDLKLNNPLAPISLDMTEEKAAEAVTTYEKNRFYISDPAQLKYFTEEDIRREDGRIYLTPEAFERRELEKTTVRDLMIKYPRAGITPVHTFQQAMNLLGVEEKKQEMEAHNRALELAGRGRDIGVTIPALEGEPYPEMRASAINYLLGEEAPPTGPYDRPKFDSEVRWIKENKPDLLMHEWTDEEIEIELDKEGKDYTFKKARIDIEASKTMRNKDRALWIAARKFKEIPTSLEFQDWLEQGQPIEGIMEKPKKIIPKEWEEKPITTGEGLVAWWAKKGRRGVELWKKMMEPIPEKPKKEVPPKKEVLKEVTPAEFELSFTIPEFTIPEYTRTLYE
ncbi:MAG: hypothetical protein AB1414_01275 [bacterium]